MNKNNAKNPKVESLTVGQLIVSIKPSQLSSIIGMSVTIIAFVFYCGYQVSKHSGELDMKTYLLKDAEEHNKFQGQINNLERDNAELRKKNEHLQENNNIYHIKELQIIKLPTKERAVIKVPPKWDDQ